MMSEVQPGLRTWELNEDAGMIGVSGPSLAHHESVTVVEVAPIAAEVQPREAGTIYADVTASMPTECCGRGPYRVDDGPWRCSCGRTIAPVMAPHISLADPASALRAVLQHPEARERHEAAVGAAHVAMWQARARQYEVGKAPPLDRAQVEVAIAAYLDRVLSADALASGVEGDDGTEGEP